MFCITCNLYANSLIWLRFDFSHCLLAKLLNIECSGILSDLGYSKHILFLVAHTKFYNPQLFSQQIELGKNVYMYIGVIDSSQAAIFTAQKTTNFCKWHVTRNVWHQHIVNKSHARIKHAFSACYMCELMHAISTSSTSIEYMYYKQQYCTMFIG